MSSSSQVTDADFETIRARTREVHITAGIVEAMIGEIKLLRRERDTYAADLRRVHDVTNAKLAAAGAFAWPRCDRAIDLALAAAMQRFDEIYAERDTALARIAVLETPSPAAGIKTDAAVAREAVIEAAIGWRTGTHDGAQLALAVDYLRKLHEEIEAAQVENVLHQIKNLPRTPTGGTDG